ncbi:hypothetical protein NP233_g8454 [Leucocoprinus birnbaumii]|uniref:Cyclochlorotine biosynthesis protein O n=1 Tax=Leucocoprinus birnbaumii TaxID=56174 RepID=A0AAD5YP25_9AGAR|nr:hypothetical protein NP233_g8454 [Leucocoprinus birnbaumii]
MFSSSESAERLLGSEYTPLPSHDKETEPDPTPSPPSRRRKLSHFAFPCLFLMSVLLNGILFYTRKPERIISEPFAQLTYSPATDHIEYEKRRFTRGLAYEIPIYEQPPSPEVDQAWEELHMWAGTKVPASIARKMDNKTWSIPDQPGYWLTSLDVFHVLHCLDMVRQYSFPEDYPEMQKLSKIHIRHCIGAIRQSLMCFSDITPIVWQWNETLGVGDERDDVVHTCRKFDRIQEWGKKNFYSSMLDLETHVEWDINA